MSLNTKCSLSLLILFILTPIGASSSLTELDEPLFSPSPVILKEHKSDSRQSARLNQMRIPQNRYEELENTFPRLFRGFSATDFSLLETYRGREELLSTPNVPISLKLTELLRALDGMEISSVPSERLDHFKRFRTYLRAIHSVKQLHSAEMYLDCLIESALALSRASEHEECFFRSEGFSELYSLVLKYDQTKKIQLVPLKRTPHSDVRGDFQQHYYRVFGDPKGEIKSLILKGPFYSVPYWMLCTKEKSDVFGVYYLAMMYYRGIHPIPVTTFLSQDKLHGISMSPWGKCVHDLGHSIADQSNLSVTQFTNNILNHYLEKYRQDIEQLEAPQKSQYVLSALRQPIAQFALSVHNAYHQSLLGILEVSLKEMHVLDEENMILDNVFNTKKLPDDFKAFAAAAFVHAHENSRNNNLSTHYATPNLHKILEKTVGERPSSVPDESTNINTDSQGGDTEDLFKTSFFDGISPLSDEDIIDLVKAQPLKNYLGRNRYNQDAPILDTNIVNCRVTRNVFYIEVEVELVNGGTEIFRENTNRKVHLNFTHDRRLLLPARAILLAQYGYEILVTPKFSDNTLQQDVEGVVKQHYQYLQKGRQHLLDYFLKTAINIADKTSISHDFSKVYAAELETLNGFMPTFIGDTQVFLDAAIAQSSRSLGDAQAVEVEAAPEKTSEKNPEESDL